MKSVHYQCARGLAVLGFAALSANAFATPITLVADSINMFRDTRGANSVNVTPGDRFQFGALVVGGSTGTSLGATYAPTGFNVSQFACSPLAVSPNFCSRTTAFDPSRLSPWTFTFKNGADELSVQGPSLAGTETAVPFPVSVTLSGSGLTPTISWSVPGGFLPDGFRVQIFDKDRVNPVTGSVDVIHSVPVSSNATSYTLPAILSTGLPMVAGGNYAINLQLIDTRDGLPFAGNNAQILRRSSSFFDFTPLTGASPPAVALPTIVAGVYNFNVAEVGPTSITFIDPDVAVGYDYQTGANDPNFASVILPNIGDGNFTLEYLLNGIMTSVSLSHGAQFFFQPGGVSAFRVLGIETSVGLDPTNATAFITGLTFANNGSFTGTMTPITQFVDDPGVPLPAGVWLLALGLISLRATASRR